MKSDPSPNCRRCHRLATFRRANRKAEPTWFNAPVPTWMPGPSSEPVQLLIVGLAPGLKGANRSGRAFTGDASGELLIPTLQRFGFARGDFDNSADDGLELQACAITNAVRCVPPENRPTGPEIEQCRPFLKATLKDLPHLKIILTLGKIAHDSTLKALGLAVRDYPFAHHRLYELGGLRLMSSYHCSRYNVNTGRLTPTMFSDVFRDLRRLVDGGDQT